MPIDPMFWLATAAFAWGLSLASYRWFAVHNGWPMGEWQAHRPGLPIAIGLLAMVLSVFFAFARGGDTVLILPIFGVVCALAWTALTRVAAQSALILAPLAVIALLAVWMSAASRLAPGNFGNYRDERSSLPQATYTSSASSERDRLIPGSIPERDRGIATGTPGQPGDRRSTGTVDRDRAIPLPVPGPLQPNQR